MAMEVESRVTVAVRRPLQPRDSNVAASPVVKAPNKARERLAPQTVVKSSYAVKAESSRVEETKEVSLAEELEKARQRRGWLRAAREVTERALEERAETLRREASDWERRGDEQRRLVAELMRLLGLPDVSTVYEKVESLRSKEERKRKEATAAHSSGSPEGSTSTPLRLQAEIGLNCSCGEELEATVTTATTESSY